VASYLGAAAAIALVLAPERLTFLGALPSAVATTGRGLAAALAVFGMVCLIEVIRARRMLVASR
jgi:hypothetical protein